MLLNAVILSVLVMLVLALLRVHVVLSLFIGALTGGIVAGLSLGQTMVAFQEGLAGGAKIALSYALLGAFAMAVAHSGLPQLLASWIIDRLDGEDDSATSKVAAWTKWGIVGGTVAMAVMSQNLIPIHIAFIPLLIPPLLVVMSRLRIDRRAIACAMTFGLVTTYMFLPIGFGRIFLHDLLYKFIGEAGLDVTGVNPLQAMAIPAAGMALGLLTALLVTYRKPRDYDVEDTVADTAEIDSGAPVIDGRKVLVALGAIIICVGLQTWLALSGSEADPMLIGTLIGLLLFVATGVVKWRDAEDVFSGGMRMMSLIGLIMITANGFASVMKATGHIEPLVKASAELFSGNKAGAALAMLVVGLVITMGIGSSFSTLPIITTIYVPLCIALGFSPIATVAIVGTAGALGDAGSPASDSTLGPTSGLNVDGQHDHMRDTVIPTFLHFNVPLLLAGWVAAMVL
ncbi:TRAP transporter large permease subunit [Schaalia sp. 19OD2882]|uniref:Na+/H+ antiporter family protein n=1 Tax=Schaalia sp. 19OD2882 TaxID=2794089 RepID=UPI001C1EF9AD|nr:Na+/H+ antiporter NhaC family protein [Schaalia sp. 19OD2882]QWW19051.1 TRAP transporter large permease subunit [Schaalia sp. 19OD2882]